MESFIRDTTVRVIEDNQTHIRTSILIAQAFMPCIWVHSLKNEDAKEVRDYMIDCAQNGTNNQFSNVPLKVTEHLKPDHPTQNAAGNFLYAILTVAGLSCTYHVIPSIDSST